MEREADLSLSENIPVCASLWSVPAPATLFSVPGLLHAPVAEQEASSGGFKSASISVSTDMKDNDIQTEEKSSNTNDDWESVMWCVDEYSSRLKEEYDSVLKQDADDQTENRLHIESLKKTRDEKKRQYQVLIDRIESLQVKLDLNSSKTTRKNFTVKLQELTAEKERLADGNKKLAQELEEAERKLKMLSEEQSSEKLSWEKEIADLQAQKERLSKQLEEANQIALKDEITALESRRDLAISQLEDWIAEAERYLGTLRLHPSPQRAQMQLEWEKNLMMVRNNLSRLQNMYNENFKLLQKGQQLDSLPAITLPSLPSVPTIELFMSPLRSSMQMQFYGGPMMRMPPPGSLPVLHHAGIPAHRVMAPPPVTSSQNFPAPTMTMPTANPSQPPFRMPTMPLPHPPPHTHPSHTLPRPIIHPAGPAHISTATTNMTTPTSATQAAAAGRLVNVPARNPAPQTVPANPPPAGKLDKLLERLGTQFPQCTRTQMTGVLQQIKSERGTMAGMSIDEVTQQVSQRLAQNDRPPPGPIAPPSGSRVFSAPPGPVQRPSVQPLVMRPPLPVFQPRPTQAPPMRKLCLMCQNHVEPGTQYNTNCTHTLHQECISVWLKSSKNNTCPFCPSK